MEEEEKVENSLSHKSFLIVLKYIPHITAFGYIIYSLLGFFGFDEIWIGYIFHLSIISWLFLYLTSFVFKYCYVHRLPLYYIALNELLTNIDYYIGIPIKDINLFLIHLTILIFIIFGYSIYYIKFRLK